MENDLNGRQPRWKTTSMEDDLNERLPQNYGSAYEAAALESATSPMVKSVTALHLQILNSMLVDK